MLQLASIFQRLKKYSSVCYVTLECYAIANFFGFCSVVCSVTLEVTICCLVISHTDVLKAGAWQLLQDINDPELRNLAESLPITVLHSRATSSTRKHLGAFKHWKAWATEHALPVFPAQAQHVSLCLQHLAGTLESNSAAEEAVNAIGWVHNLAGVVSPAGSPFIRATLEGIQRMLACPVEKKQPITSKMLAEVVEDTNKHSSLSNIRLATACLLSYASFLCFDELVHFRPCDIEIDTHMARVHIHRSKTDQLQRGDEVLIARTGTPTCPVAMLERYMGKPGIDKRSSLFLFRAITKTKARESLRSSGSISYSRLRELFKLKLEELGYPAGKYGLHSLRAGGSTAAANAGVPDQLFKRHGRWRSKNAKDEYVDDSLQSCLTVSKLLGL